MATQALPIPIQAPVDGPGLLRGDGRAVLGGNELIVKGALEAGVSLITGYPGSPVAEVFLICEEHAAALADLGVEAILANNEAQSAAMLNGARQVPGARSMTVFKSVVSSRWSGWLSEHHPSLFTSRPRARAYRAWKYLQVPKGGARRAAGEEISRRAYSRRTSARPS